MEKGPGKVVHGSFVGPSPGPPLEIQIVKKLTDKSVREAHRKTLCAKCYTRGLSASPPTLNMMAPFTRNHRFHISTWTSKILKIAANGYPFEWFWGPLDTRTTLKKIAAEEISRGPSIFENDGFVYAKPLFSHFCLVRGILRVSSLETPLEPESATNRKKVGPRSTLKNTDGKVLHKRSLRIPSNL